MRPPWPKSSSRQHSRAVRRTSSKNERPPSVQRFSFLFLIEVRQFRLLSWECADISSVVARKLSDVIFPRTLLADSTGPAWGMVVHQMDAADPTRGRSRFFQLYQHHHGARQ